MSSRLPYVDLNTAIGYGAAKSIDMTVLGVNVQIQGKRQSTLNLGHQVIWQLAEPSLKPHCWQRPETLNIDDRGTVKKGEFWQYHLVGTLSVLGGQRHIEDQRTRWVRVTA
jgi:hypothetical protein